MLIKDADARLYDGESMSGKDGPEECLAQSRAGFGGHAAELMRVRVQAIGSDARSNWPFRHFLQIALMHTALDQPPALGLSSVDC